jgi:hypothetical protein
MLQRFSQLTLNPTNPYRIVNPTESLVAFLVIQKFGNHLMVLLVQHRFVRIRVAYSGSSHIFIWNNFRQRNVLDTLTAVILSLDLGTIVVLLYSASLGYGALFLLLEYADDSFVIFSVRISNNCLTCSPLLDSILIFQLVEVIQTR